MSQWFLCSASVFTAVGLSQTLGGLWVESGVAMVNVSKAQAGGGEVTQFSSLVMSGWFFLR